MLRYLALCLLLCSPAFADELVPVVDPPPVPEVSGIVAPKEVSGTGKKLDPYVFTKSTRCILRLIGPNTDVSFDIEDAPTDTEIIENRYASFSLYQNGTYQLTAHGGSVYSKVWFQIKSGTDPPVPEPDPLDPTPDVKPVVGPLYVVIVKDGKTLSKLPSSQLQALLSVKVREYCDTHCFKGSDGKTPEFRSYDIDTDVGRQSPQIQEGFKLAVADRAKANESGPWITISNGKSGFSGPFGTTEAAVIEKLKIYGGP